MMGSMKQLYILAGVLLVLALPVYAAGQGSEVSAPSEGAGDAGPDSSVSDEESQVADPIEPLNRVFFTFNDRLYFWLLKPVARGYGAVVPEWGRIRVRNMFHNVKMPVRFVNSVLQLKMQNAVKELARFLVNTTAGIGGMFDILEGNADARPTEEDFGQTLGFYGIGDGVYIVLPVLGPSSLRDTFGRAGNYYLDPVNLPDDRDVVFALNGADRVNSTSLRIGEYEDLIEASVDPYTAVKDVYIQYRRNKVRE